MDEVREDQVPMEPDTSEGGEAPVEGVETTPEEVSAEYHEASFAVLLALVPLLVFTLFGQIGLF